MLDLRTYGQTGHASGSPEAAPAALRCHGSASAGDPGSLPGPSGLADRSKSVRNYVSSLASPHRNPIAEEPMVCSTKSAISKPGVACGLLCRSFLAARHCRHELATLLDDEALG